MDAYTIFKLVTGLAIYGAIAYGVYVEIRKFVRWVRNGR